MSGDGDFEEAPRLVERGFAEQRTPHLQHEVVVVLEAQRDDAVEAGDGAAPLAELEEHFAKPRQGVFMLGVEAHRFLERPARPEILLARQPGVPHADVQLDGVRIERQPFSQGLDGVVVLSVVVQLMRAFVVVVGAQERFRHRTGLPGRLCYDMTARAVTQAMGPGYFPAMSSGITEIPSGSVTSPRGFSAAAAHVGLKADGAPDVALLVSATSCATAGVFTKNALRAAPVTYDADLLAERPGRIRAVAMNARVANACTGAPGLAAARAMAQAAEQAAGLPARTALVLSTGVIGVPLPLEQISSGLQTAAAHLTADGGPEAARAVMTTDTRPKHCAVRFETPAGMITVGGIAKGAGMIHPDMATLLAVLTTDAAGEPAALQPLLRREIG